MRELMIYLINMCEVLISDVTSSDVRSREVTSCDATCNVTRHDVKRCADTCHDADCILHNLVGPPPPPLFIGLVSCHTSFLNALIQNRLRSHIGSNCYYPPSHGR